MLPQLLEHERKTSFVGEYLTKVDGATMYYGLEARSPFLDQCLWDFVNSLPVNLRLYHGRLKSLLREMASRRIGNEIARRRKRGFGVPVQRWIGGHWYPRIEELLHDSLLARDSWICKDAVLKELKTAKQKGWATQPLWHIVVLELWFRVESAGSLAVG
jgi:asparagine synthase (glutamine-hydrolysing)